jgi:hypothetical protein
VPQLVSVLELHDLVHHGTPVMQVACPVQSELVVHGSPVGFALTPPPSIPLDPGIGAQYDGVAEEDDTGLQVALLYWEQSASVEQLGTHAFPAAVMMHRLGWLTLLAPHPALDTQGWVQNVPWQVLPVGHWADLEQGSPTCEPPPPLEPPLLAAPLLVPPPLLVAPLLEPVPSLDPSSDELSDPTA